MAVPTEYPAWATSEVTELRVIDGTPVNLLNKVEPPAEWKLSGELYQENLPRAYINYQFDNINDWVVNINVRTSRVGQVYLTTDAAETVSTLATDFGGTWTARGTDTLGTSGTIYVFERTA